MALPSGAADSVPGSASVAHQWTGFYAGGHLGDAWGHSDWESDPTLSGSFGLYHGYNAFTGTGSYFAGLQLGYNYELPSKVVFGVTTDVSFPNTVAGVQTFTSPSIGQASFGETVEYSGTLRGRVGYAIGDRLLYATGGLAWSDDRFTRTQIVGTPVGGTATPGTSESQRLLPRPAPRDGGAFLLRRARPASSQQ